MIQLGDFRYIFQIIIFNRMLLSLFSGCSSIAAHLAWLAAARHDSSTRSVSGALASARSASRWGFKLIPEIIGM